MIIIGTKPSAGLIVDDVIDILKRNIDEFLVLQLVGKWEKSIQPVRPSLVQSTISISTYPTRVHDVGPEEREVSRETICLEDELVPEPTLRLDGPQGEGAKR